MKSAVLHLVTNNPHLPYWIDNMIVKPVNFHCDKGIIIDVIFYSLNRLLTFVNAETYCFTFSEKLFREVLFKSLMLLFNVYVRLILESANLE